MKPRIRAHWWVIAWRWSTGNWWRPVRQCFPYKPGYATYNRGTNTVLDMNLSRESAAIICDSLNTQP